MHFIGISLPCWASLYGGFIYVLSCSPHLQHRSPTSGIYKVGFRVYGLIKGLQGFRVYKFEKRLSGCRVQDLESRSRNVGTLYDESVPYRSPH